MCWISQRDGASVQQMFGVWNPAGPLAEWNQDKSMQSCRCLGGNGDKGTQSVCLLGTALRLELQVCSCMHGRMADKWVTSQALHCLEVPTHASKSAQATVACKFFFWWMWWMNAKDHLLSRIHNNPVCDFTLKLLKELKKNQPPLKVPSKNKFLVYLFFSQSLFNTTSSFSLWHIFTSFICITSPWVASEVINLPTNTNLSTSAYIDWLRIGSYTIRWGV